MRNIREIATTDRDTMQHSRKQGEERYFLNSLYDIQIKAMLYSVGDARAHMCLLDRLPSRTLVVSMCV